MPERFIPPLGFLAGNSKGSTVSFSRLKVRLWKGGCIHALCLITYMAAKTPVIRLCNGRQVHLTPLSVWPTRVEKQVWTSAHLSLFVHQHV